MNIQVALSPRSERSAARAEDMTAILVGKVVVQPELAEWTTSRGTTSNPLASLEENPEMEALPAPSGRWAAITVTKTKVPGQMAIQIVTRKATKGLVAVRAAASLHWKLAGPVG